MRRYDIVSGILLILSIIDFALAAPVLVQEKSRSCVDVVSIPRDAIAVLGKRGFEELENLAEEFFKTSGKPVESSDAHALSSSAPPRPDLGSMNVVQAPAPNPASSRANPNPSVEPLSPPPLPLPTVFESTALSGSEDLEWLFGPKGNDKIDTATSSVHGLDHELSSVPTGPNHGSTNVVQTPAPDPVLSTANPNRLMELSNSKSSSSSDSSTSSSSISNSEDFEWLFGPEGDDKIDTATSSGHGLDHELSSVPTGPNHGSTNVVQAPAPDPALSTANLNPMIELSSSESSPTASSALSDSEDYEWLFDPGGDDKIDTATSSGHGLGHELSSVPTGPNHGSTNVVQAPAPDPASLTAKPIPLIELSDFESSPIASPARSDSKYKWLFEPQAGQMIDFSQPSRNKRPWIESDPKPKPKPGVIPNFWTAYVNRPRPESASPNEIDQISEYQAGAGDVQKPEPELWIIDSGFDLDYFHVPARVVHLPSTSAGLPTRPEHVVTPSESTPNPAQPMDPQADSYAAQGKAKESRRISGITRNVGNPARGESQLDEKPLDPGE